MRHFDAWILRDPYSIWHYYSTGRRWQETVRDMIQERKICSPPIPSSNENGNSIDIDPYSRPFASQPPTCSLLHKLPLEIRRMIYDYVFGDETIHLVQLKGKIRHVRCHHTASSLANNRHCCPVTPARWRVYDGRIPGHSDGMLYPHTHALLPEMLSNSSPSLLRTCRQIYAEAAELLYSAAEFDVDDLHTFVAFAAMLRPALRARIRKLTVQWMPVWQPLAGEETPASIFAHTHNDALWKAFWMRVAALPGLQELRLSLDLGWFGAHPGVDGGAVTKNRLKLKPDQPWVAPLFRVRGLKDFELGITARCDALAKPVLEDELTRDAVALRDCLKSVMYSAPGEAVPAELPVMVTGCTMESQPERKIRSRLAITAT